MSELYGVRGGLTPISRINPKFKYNLWEVVLQLPIGTVNVIIKAIGVIGAIDEAISYYNKVINASHNPTAIMVYSYPDKETVWRI